MLEMAERRERPFPDGCTQSPPNSAGRGTDGAPPAALDSLALRTAKLTRTHACGTRVPMGSPDPCGGRRPSVSRNRETADPRKTPASRRHTEVVHSACCRTVSWINHEPSRPRAFALATESFRVLPSSSSWSVKCRSAL